jgi:tetratricopeptide (TPR) repeat protein
MDLPVWQTLYNELGSKGFVPISVAFDSDGNRAVEPWITAANPTYPCLIDRAHIVAELYDMVNVPTAVWIDERGKIVRPSEPAGVTDAFRTMDRKTFAMPAEALEELQSKRKAYVDAIRDWIVNGSASRFALTPDEVLRRMHAPNDDHVRAAANFRLGQYLYDNGDKDAAQRYFEEAKRLRPESWNYKRQAWSLKDPGNPLSASGPEFWSAVEALGPTRYYPEVKDI